MNNIVLSTLEKKWIKRVITISIVGIILFIIGIAVIELYFDYWLWKIAMVTELGLGLIFIEVTIAYRLKPRKGVA